MSVPQRKGNAITLLVLEHCAKLPSALAVIHARTVPARKKPEVGKAASAVLNAWEIS